MKRLGSKYLFPVQVFLVLLASASIPGLGLAVAGAMSTTRSRMNIFANVAFVASGLLGLRWLDQVGLADINDGSVAFQVYFHTFAGAFLICFGVFLGAVSGSIAINGFLVKGKSDLKVSIVFFLLMMFLIQVGFRIGYAEAAYAFELAEEHLREI